MQHLSTCLVVHLDPTMSHLLFTSTVIAERETSASANYTIRQIIAITEEPLVYSVKVYSL